ncbi:MAG: amino acid permease [Mucilaginibacter polytrichastri]|nr:amino acid permease [Mucilaginibacter polytrichastri]
MHIQPRLNRFDLTMIVISLVIGMGIFRSPAEVAIHAGSAWIALAVWIIGGVVTLCGALTFAEIGSRLPAAGGFYKVFSYCYHPAFAFMINWVIVISNAASVAAVAIAGAEYINPFLLPQNLQNDTGMRITTFSTIGILYGINFLGIKTSARLQNILSVFKALMVLMLCLAVFRSDAYPAVVQASPSPHGLIAAFGLSLVPVFFTYGGYQQTINFGGDIIDAPKNIPKAVKTGICTVILLYVLVNIAYLQVLGLGGLQKTPTLAAAMAGTLFGPTGYKITSLLLFLSVVAYINVNILSNPRIYYAMAEDGVLPQIFRRVNPRTQVQDFAMSFFVLVIVLILLVVQSFGDMLNYVMFFDTIGLSAAAMSIFLLRKKQGENAPADHYAIAWFPLVPLVFILTYWFVTISIFIDNPKATGICLVAFAIGLVIYYASKRLNRA